MDIFDLRLWPGFAEAGGDTTSPAYIDQVAIDSRRIDSSQALFVPLLGENFDGHQFVSHAADLGSRYALVQKDWIPSKLLGNLILLRVKDPLEAFQSIAQTYRRQLKTQVIAIIGSYGKTMVKDLLQAMVAGTKSVAASPESFNSQIGAALSLFTIRQEHEVALIEAGISKQHEMDRLAAMIEPDAVIVTHIGKKHLATLGNIQTTAAEMFKLVAVIPKEKWALLPNAPIVQPHLSQLSAVINFWNEEAAHLPHATTVANEHGSHMPYRLQFPDGSSYTSKTGFGFYYFLDLINITAKAAWLIGVSSEAIQAALAKYTAEPMRTEIWNSSLGTTFINDTYCSDPQSIDRSLKSFEQIAQVGKKIFVFGGMRGQRHHEKAEYRHIGRSISTHKIERLLLVGDHDFSSLINEVSTLSPETSIEHHPKYHDAITEMRPWIQPNDVVLIKGERKESLDRLMEVFNDSICSNQCVINFAAIQANIMTIRNKLAPRTRVMAVVKALAYGTNDIRIGQFLETCGVDILGVSYVEEGVALKRAGISQSIFIVNAATYEAAKVVKWGLEVGVSEISLITALAQEASQRGKIIKVHLHVDTGMNRFGCRPEEALELAQFILAQPSLKLEGIMTHFACADCPADDEFTLSQARKFEEVIDLLKKHEIDIPWAHAANSSAVMRFDFPQFNMVRIGLAIYGLYSSEAAKNAMELRLALSLISHVVGINLCKAGETISYGRSYVVAREAQRIAVLPIGYFDGLHRNYSGKASVIIRGKHAPMVGKICMDFMMVDITDIPNAEIGDSVLIFGEDEYGHYLSPEELATSGDSIVHELVTCLGPRIQRIFVHEEADKLR
jgi:alanine racemase/UDP-N-acetylmuramoyl-tripeptide--D-alanyl-D-alanine ligase